MKHVTSIRGNFSQILLSVYQLKDNPSISLLCRLGFSSIFNHNFSSDNGLYFYQGYFTHFENKHA